MDNTAAKLARAIETGDFAAAQSLALDFGRAVRTDFELAAGAEERQKILNGALEVLGDRLHLARVMRSHISARLQVVAGQLVYDGAAWREPAWRVDG